MEVIATSCSSMGVFVILALLFTISLPTIINAQSLSPSPLADPVSTSDGTAVDQGIAYVLMLVALIVTYMLH